jgi:glutamate racemase
MDADSYRPIGAFDSGIGGISVLLEIQALLPREDLCYVADSAQAPYGEKSDQEIRQRTLEIGSFLLDQGAKALVLACNTATAAAAKELRRNSPVPVVAMEPAIKPAIRASMSKKIGVLATAGTLRSQRFQALLRRYANGAEVFVQACPGLVERVEQGDLDGPLTRSLLRGYALNLLQQGADILVLGCTHYPFLRPILGEIVGDGVPILDTGQAVARHLRNELERLGLCNPQPGPGRQEFWTTGCPKQCARALQRVWPESVQVQALEA